MKPSDLPEETRDRQRRHRRNKRLAKLAQTGVLKTPKKLEKWTQEKNEMFGSWLLELLKANAEHRAEESPLTDDDLAAISKTADTIQAHLKITVDVNQPTPSQICSRIESSDPDMVAKLVAMARNKEEPK